MVIHILRDGSRVNDISGHIVKVDEAKTLYSLMDSINRKRSERTTEKAR